MANQSIECPSCKAMISVPSNIHGLDCPNCKHHLTLPKSPATQPKPVEKIVTAKAILINPNAEVPKLLTAKLISPGTTPAAPAPVQTDQVLTAKLIMPTPTQPEKVTGSIVDEVAEAEEKQRQDRRALLKRELSEMRDEEIEYRKKFSITKHHTWYMRLSLHFTYWGIRMYMLAIVLMMALGAMYVFAPAMANIIILFMSLICLASCVLITAGFGLAIAGHPVVRVYGYIGMGICVVHMLILAIEALAGIRFTGELLASLRNEFGLRRISEAGGAYYGLGLGTNLFAVSDSMIRLIYGWKVPWIGLIAAGFEFSRMAVIVLMMQLFAELGKSPELGFRAFRSINVFFWNILILTTIRTCVTPIFVPEGPEMVVGPIIHASIFLIGILVYGLQLLSLANVCDDIRYICNAERFLSTGTVND